MFIIGITGGSASGKTLACRTLSKKLSKHGKVVSIMSEDNFYHGLPDGMNSSDYDFDSPSAIDFDSMYRAVHTLKSGAESVEIPTYNFTIHKVDGHMTIKSCDVLIVEGILLFSFQKLFGLFNLKIYVDASPEIRLIRRIKRDVTERGRDLDSVFRAYLKFVKPSYDRHIAPTKSNADIVINNESNDGDHHLSSKMNIILSHILSYGQSSDETDESGQELLLL